MKGLWRATFWAVVFSSIFLVNAFATAILSVQPSSTSVAAGTTFAVDVNISSVSDLYALQFEIGFTPGVLSAISSTEGSFLPSGGTTAFLPGTIDNTGGSISFIADTLIGAISGVSGSGTLAILDFKALASGTSPINITGPLFLNSSLSPPLISVTIAGGSAMVTGGTVPEPSSLLMLVSGALAGVAVMRKKLSS